jgi:hypothetical protein
MASQDPLSTYPKTGKATPRRWIALVGTVLLAGAGCSQASEQSPGTTRGERGDLPKFSAPTKIDNPYLPLTERRECTSEGKEGDTTVREVETLLDRTRPIRWNGTTITARIVRFRSYEDNEFVEETLDYYAQADDGAVYYFGEDVDNYEQGKIVDHEGTWHIGRDTDIPGVIMAAHPRKGTWFRSEDVPPITLEQDVVVEDGLTLEVPAGKFTDVIKVHEILAPSGDVDTTYFARGTGQVREQTKDGTLDLVSCTKD